MADDQDLKLDSTAYTPLTMKPLAEKGTEFANNTHNVHLHQRRAPDALSPSGTCPTRSQPYGSSKHIVLDVKAGGPGKVACNRYSV
ncbi:hypothetical protein FOXB_01693 [Fusarium oxysporum f. sp. conglutinans Fo5176]|uniref:Uncharacterized protein n=3 Tax=Fusarium oxysporum TaxID=5507 RepID=F9F5L8_FUSOF|nr:hypothetical protein FOXB_01693 [Fusarium oxysporum f. sp. conglutinans Fo5176]